METWIQQFRTFREGGWSESAETSKGLFMFQNPGPQTTSRRSGPRKKKGPGPTPAMEGPYEWDQRVVPFLLSKCCFSTEH